MRLTQVSCVAVQRSAAVHIAEHSTLLRWIVVLGCIAAVCCTHCGALSTAALDRGRRRSAAHHFMFS